MRSTKPDRMISIDRELVDLIFAGAKSLYPKESILLLRGRKSENMMKITDLLVPPLANYGRGFAEVPLHRLPMDFSIVGTVHSHPSGNLSPSSTDLNHFVGTILMIVAYPFADEKNLAVYARNGERTALQITEI